MTIYTDPRLLNAGLVGGTLSRHNGTMREVTAQTPVYEQLGIPTARMLHFHQTHSDTLLTIHNDADARHIQTSPMQDADAWLCAASGWGTAILTADCVPLFLWEAHGTAFALAHCGWRGVVKELPFKAATALRRECPNGRILAWAGPHIQVCCFEVQEDTASQFPPECVVRKNGKLFVDLNRAIIIQLTKAGLCAQDIKTPYYCTCGDSANFFSWRRDHKKESLLSFIYKP